MTVVALPASTQGSTPCTTAPCVQVAYEDYTGHLASDAKHFIYAPEGEEVELGVYAEFTPGSCTGHCVHSDRSVTWTVSGAEGYSVLEVESSIPYNVNATSIQLNLGDAGAGDTISVTCAIGATTPGDCDEKKNGDLYEHTPNSHGGASATCTIKLWRAGMSISNATESVPEIYDSEFASVVGAQIELVGATPASGPGIQPYSWESREHGDDLIATMTGSNQWSGKFVVETLLLCDVVVENPMVPNGTRSQTVGAQIYPIIRRPGWEASATHGAVDLQWREQFADAFPIVNADSFIAYGQNTNSNEKYEDQNTVIVTPIYAVLPNLPNDYDDFESKIEEITSGPNIGYWFNSDPDIFKVNRKTRINYWTTPNAGKPSVPALGPNGQSYVRWAGIQTALLGDSCDTTTCTANDEPCYPNSCPNPNAHDGVGNNVRHRANIWHEGYGCPSSDNQDEIGHQALLEEAVAGTPNKAYHDPVWSVNLVYATSDEALRTVDELTRALTNQNLTAAMLQSHASINSTEEWHNFQGRRYFHDGTQWQIEWGFYGGGY